MNIDLKQEIQDLLDAKRKLVKDSDINTIEIFRINYDSFEGLISFFKKNRSYSKVNGETAYGEISKLLASKGVFSKTGNPLSTESVATYLSIVRLERKRSDV